MGVLIWKFAAVKKNGFTMAELMIAVGIISLLTIAGLVAMQNQSVRARDQRRQSDIEQIRASLEQYRLTTVLRVYPTPTPGIASQVLATDLANFLPTIPLDPSAGIGRRYYYRSPMPGGAADGTSYVLCARLESMPAGGTGCPAGACGPGGDCNFQRIQP